MRISKGDRVTIRGAVNEVPELRTGIVTESNAGRVVISMDDGGMYSVALDIFIRWLTQKAEIYREDTRVLP